ncbi:MAG: succinate dehydrogenase, cytochrome b556 subunit [Wenzhouxiangellaceae bacterium]|nr:succinate dehydrogenase, cytochrome b556 subunit [Wenzhouxiangellaceae bacterium]
MTTDQRPLSPHLQIYRPEWTSVLSIVHRLTGVLLSAGTVLMAAWLVALARGAEDYAALMSLMAHPVMLLLLVAWTLALFYHLLNGVRHLLWDVGMLFDLGKARASGWAVVVGSLVLTAVVWGGLL